MYLYGLLSRSPQSAEVTAIHDRRLPGVLTHRVRRLDIRDVSLHRGIPITTAPRTLVDIAGRLELHALARACHEAEVRHRVGKPAVAAGLSRHPNAPGAAKLHEIFGGRAPVTLSKLERDFRARLEEARLELPETNRRIDGHYVDCRWPEQRLTVELDGYRYHHTRHAWEQDRRRAREAYARGDEFRRYTYGDVNDEPELMLAELRRLLP